MTLTRESILTILQARLEPLPFVIALWLEGADATGYVDEYSDIDLCCSVTQGALEETAAHARSVLEGLGRLDLAQESRHSDNFLSNTFHLEGTSPYLMIDFDVVFDRGSTFTRGDPIEKPRILFDKRGVVRFVEPDEQATAKAQVERLKALEGMVAQYPRLEKYLLRGQYLEAFGYYHKYLLEPLIEVLRMRYTPLHSDYYIVHISRHFPADVLSRVEYFFQPGSLVDLGTRSREALALFKETAAWVRSGSSTQG